MNTSATSSEPPESSASDAAEQPPAPTLAPQVGVPALGPAPAAPAAPVPAPPANEAKALQAQIRAERDRRVRLTALYGALVQKNDQLCTDTERLAHQLAEAEELARRMYGARRTRAALEKQLDDFRRALSAETDVVARNEEGFQRRLASDRQETDKLRRDCAESIAKMEASLATLRDLYTKKSARLEEKRDALAGSNAELATARDHARQTAKRKRALEAEQAALKRNLERANADLARVDADRAARSKSLLAKYSAVKDKNRECQELEQQINEKRLRLEALKDETEALLRRRQTADARLRGLVEERVGLSRTAQQEREQQARELEQVRRLRDAFRAKVERARAEADAPR